jgi:uncharacterized protein YkwD
MVMVAEQGRRGTTGTITRRKRRKPVKTGLIATGAAVAVSAVAVSAGLLPTPNGSGGFSFQDDGSISQAQAGNATSASPTGGSDPSPQERTSAPASQGDAPSNAPVTTPPASRPAAPAPPPATPSAQPTTAPSSSASATTTAPSPSATPSASASQPATADTSPEGQVLTLVNVERAKIGCSPLVMDQPLAKLAEDFTKDMAQRNFFDHTDPDGDDPWERAKLAGITDLGGENIARGQADVQAVMAAWMNSPGHRANILNCDYTTLGVGIHFGPGGPWWTQDFGY